ncbi:hypothetical protein HH1059_20060 [Halorhodospira halochloris]|uniref:Probable ATP-binding protein BrxC winged helix-turn-helix domain-containing protein n=1 Tax=Halorhodospira halochloris TaxID=1052 RepID=A0A0X8XAY7_HALHR|nr:BREX system P-loop protein BrxC [Halorhodospira halochloris]BAU58710.1 hypothetical protein HH1059_20060 [Halorhodospira halochloris]
MAIKDLFDPSRDIYRSIEKVIAFGVSQEERLKKEIAEYVVTDAIDEQFNDLLRKMQAAMDAGGENEVGVWVSGFYGSGKSSFTKYLGLAFDESVTVDGVPFRQHLQDRLKSSSTRQLLNNVAKRFPAAVLMLDLATEQVSGATMAEVSSVLYYKVLQWAGYSRNLKVAYLERRLKQEGRYEEFLEMFREKTNGEDWSGYRNDELVIDSLIPEIAHELYPQLFPTQQAFNTESTDVVRFENDRVQEMLEIVREASGKEYVIFIIDEVGQYVGSRPQMILNLDGLAKNIKAQGQGKVWIIGTGQQTLTEDVPGASVNSQELFKLKDRFPININLQADDIKEICYRRLLGKSAEGSRQIGELFDQYGQALRQSTKLEDARAYGADFDRQTFIDLYPFLPAHFDILLHLLGSLARSTGGIGLRSAIKVIQDILVDETGNRTPVADRPVGWLANNVILYDALEKDIERAFPTIHKAVANVYKTHYVASELHQRVAKTVAVLQILGNLPITRRNVASLMHPDATQPSEATEVEGAIEDLIGDSYVPFGEQNGGLRFFSEKLNDIEQERSKLPIRQAERKRLINIALGEAFSPLPTTQLGGSLSVQSGLKVQNGGLPTSLAGERNSIQTLVELVDPADYEAARTRLTDESVTRNAEQQVLLIGRYPTEIDDLTAEIHRSQEIANKYRNEPDQEVKEYCKSQQDRAARLQGELQRQLKRSLVQGSFIFRGQVTAVETLSSDLIEAARKHLAEVATQVFDRYSEAPVCANTDLAERFLRVGNLNGVTSQLDPLGLVQTVNGQPQINTQNRAIVSIRDHVDKVGQVEGKSLTKRFSEAPFGWSQDTLRYLVAAMLMAGVIKLRVGGRDVTVNGQQAQEALKTNNAFKNVGVSLRDDSPSNEMLALAAERLTEFTGESVVPLEDEISRTAMGLFPKLQQRFAQLSAKLTSLELPGGERLGNLTQAMVEMQEADASDAPQRLWALHTSRLASWRSAA